LSCWPVLFFSPLEIEVKMSVFLPWGPLSGGPRAPHENKCKMGPRFTLGGAQRLPALPSLGFCYAVLHCCLCSVGHEVFATKRPQLAYITALVIGFSAIFSGKMPEVGPDASAQKLIKMRFRTSKNRKQWKKSAIKQGSFQGPAKKASQVRPHSCRRGNLKSRL
jgi:hypothetical protein